VDKGRNVPVSASGSTCIIQFLHKVLTGRPMRKSITSRNGVRLPKQRGVQRKRLSKPRLKDLKRLRRKNAGAKRGKRKVADGIMRGRNML